MRNILTSVLVFLFAFSVYFANPAKSYAATCMCIPTPGLNIAVCDNANYMPSFSGIAGAGNCAGIGPFSDCSCVQKDCGGSGQHHVLLVIL